MITQRFEFAMDYTRDWNNGVYFRLNKMCYGVKNPVGARPSGEKCGLE
jgi:hypothetical protein